MSKVRSKPNRKRGALTAELVATLYVIFFFFFFPLLNLATTAMNAFFLWFACNECALGAAKCKTFLAQTVVGTTTYMPAVTDCANRATSIAGMFPGIHYKAGYPQISIILNPIPNSAAGGGTPPFKYYPVGQPLGQGNSPDVTQYVPSIKVEIVGYADPLIPVPLFNSVNGGLGIPGLTNSAPLTVATEAVFENPPGLQM